MPSRLVTLLFAFLLLGMQQEAQVHALAHFGEQLNRPHEQGLQAPAADAPCSECTLLSAGGAAAPAGAPDVELPKVAFAAPSQRFPSRAVDAPSHYSSRGPPPIL